MYAFLRHGSCLDGAVVTIYRCGDCCYCCCCCNFFPFFSLHRGVCPWRLHAEVALPLVCILFEYCRFLIVLYSCFIFFAFCSLGCRCCIFFLLSRVLVVFFSFIRCVFMYMHFFSWSLVCRMHTLVDVKSGFFSFLLAVCAPRFKYVCHQHTTLDTRVLMLQPYEWFAFGALKLHFQFDFICDVDNDDDDDDDNNNKRCLPLLNALKSSKCRAYSQCHTKHSMFIAQAHHIVHTKRIYNVHRTYANYVCMSFIVHAFFFLLLRLHNFSVCVCVFQRNFFLLLLLLLFISHLFHTLGRHRCCCWLRCTVVFVVRAVLSAE